MILNLVMFVTFLGASFVLGQAATAMSARQRELIRVKVENRRR